MIASDRPLEDVQAALRGWFTIAVGAVAEVERTYYDTFDGLLYDASLTLSIQGGVRTLTRRDGSQPENGVSAERVAGVRALLPVAKVRLTTQILNVLDERDKTVCRIVLEAPVGLRERARLVGMRGYDRDRDRVNELLVASGCFAPADAPLVDDAVLAAGGNPAGTHSKVDVSMDSSDRADAAVASVLSRLTEIMDVNLPGALADTDTEFLHDYRVAIRRTRAVMRELRGVFPAPQVERLRGDFKWLQEVTGPTRDLDVYLLEFERLRQVAPPAMRPDLDPLLAVLRSWHATARKQMNADLASKRALDVRADWGRLVSQLTGLAHEGRPGVAQVGRPDAARAIGEVAGGRIWRLYRRMVKMGRGITADSDPQEYHELRKKGKELRYMLELFGTPLHDPDVVKPLIRALKGLQDVLGVHQDRDVQASMLKRLGEQVAVQSGGTAALMAMGALLERIQTEAQTARSQFAASFAEFASDAQRKFVDATFKPRAP
jgi:CHAD domain-containing protein